MSWLGFIGGAIKLLLRFMDWKMGKEPSVEELVIQRNNKIRDAHARWDKAVKENNYEQASIELADLNDDIDAMRRMWEKRKQKDSSSE